MHGFAGALAASCALTVQLAAVAVVGWRLSARLIPEPGERLTRYLVALLIAVVDIVAVLLVLGALQLLRVVPVLVVQVTLAAVTEWRTRRVPAQAPAEPARSRGRSWGLVLAPCILVGSLALVLSLRGPSQEFDTDHYHLVNATQWVRTGSTLQIPFSLPGENQGDVPGDGELVAAWLMLPTGDDELAYVGNIGFGALCVLGVALLTAELGGDPRRGLLAGLAVVAAPLLFSTQVHSLMTDMAAGAGCVTGVALALRAARDPARVRHAVLAGLGLGLAAGSKYVALPAAAGGLAVLIILLPAGRRSRAGAAALGGAAAVAGFWYVRNAVATHNPVSPIGLRVGGRDLLPSPSGPERAIDTPLATHFLHLNWPIIRLTGHIAIDLLGPMALLALAGMVATVAIRSRRGLGLVGALAIGCAIAYTAIPLTGGGPAGELQFLIGSNFRYAAPAALLAVAAGVAAVPARVASLVIAAALVYDGVRIAQGPDFRPDLGVSPGVIAWTALVVVMVGGMVILARVAAAMSRRQARGAFLAAAGVGTLILAVSSPMAAVRRPAALSTVERALAMTDAGRSVAVIDVENVRAILAPSFDVAPVAVGDGPTGAESPILDPAGFTERLEQLGVSVVVVGPAPYPLQERPPAWSPPPWLQRVGVQDGADVYVADRNGSTARLRR